MNRLRSGKELIENPVPDIPYRVEGLLRANGGSLSITGQAKTKKSFLAIDLALRIAAGDDCLGYATSQGNVLYLNLEISSEKFQERLQDIQARLRYNDEVLSRFYEYTVLDTNIALNDEIERTQNILNQCKAKGFTVDTLVIDPRARVIEGSENEEVEIKHFCDSVDKLLTKNPGLSIIIVTHMGKDASKGAIGHSRYVGWLDTDIKIVKKPNMTCDKQLEISARDAESSTIMLDFEYPVHVVDEAQEFVLQSKVKEAETFITNALQERPRSRQVLRRKAMRAGLTDYAFTQAIKRLKDTNLVKTVQAKGPGNKKLFKLIEDKGA